MNSHVARSADLVKGLQPCKISTHKHLRSLLAQGVEAASALHCMLRRFGMGLHVHQEALEGLVTSTLKPALNSSSDQQRRS